MMKGDVLFHVTKGLPATARFRGAGYNPTNNAWVLFATDDSFAVVPEDESVPEFEVEWARVEPQD